MIETNQNPRELIAQEVDLLYEANGPVWHMGWAVVKAVVSSSGQKHLLHQLPGRLAADREPTSASLS